ncbi:SBBP repeat-containing protein [Myxococcota bacterium]|nr:SBBP repeat-containing protein [Myxococcota bacterium]
MKKIITGFFFLLLGVSMPGCDDDSSSPSGCAEGEMKLGEATCGLNDRGVLLEECVEGVWAVTQKCYDTDVCTDDATRTGYSTCGLNDRGLLMQQCAAGVWGATTTCLEVDQCTDGETRSGTTLCGYNDNGTWEQVCAGGLWTDSTVCDDTDLCVNGVQEVGSAVCGYNGAGTLIHECVEGDWVDTPTCLDPDRCVDGEYGIDEALLSCGVDGEGFQTQQCVDGDWEASLICRGDFTETQWGIPGSGDTTDICSDGRGGLYVVGHTSSTFPGEISAGGRDVFLSKLTMDGSLLWTRQWGTADNDIGQSVVADSAGNIFVGGHTLGTFTGQTSEGSNDLFLTKLTADGSPLWSRQWGSPDADTMTKMAIDTGDNLFIAGTTDGTITGEAVVGSGRAYLTKRTLDGSPLWSRQWGGGTASVSIEGLALDSQGNAYVAGVTAGAFPGYTNAGSMDIFMTKITSDGSVLWTHQWGSASLDSAPKVTVNSLDEVYLSARAGGIFPGQTTPAGMVLVMKLTTDGIVTWVHEYTDTLGIPDKSPKAIAADENYVYVGVTLDYDGTELCDVLRLVLKIGADGTLMEYRPFDHTNYHHMVDTLYLSPEGILYITDSNSYCTLLSGMY